MKASKTFPLRFLGQHLFGLLTICLLASSVGCSSNGQDSENPEEQIADYTVSVKVAPIVREGIASAIRAVGSVAAINHATISAKIPGKVEKIFVEESDRVDAGETLLCLEKTDLLLTVRQAEAALSMAEANYSKAETEWARSRELFEKGISSKQQFDLVKSSFKVAAASIEQADADLGLTRHQLENADVTTLFGGTVIDRYVDPGERVGSGQPLFEVARLNPVEIKIGVSDRRFSQLKQGQEASITVDGYPGENFNGLVKKIQPLIDPMTRTFKVTVEVANPDEMLKPGMFARAEIRTDYHADALVMPRAALLEEEGKYYAVAVRDGKAHRVEISRGFQDGDRIEVLSGLVQGDLVVIEGAYALAQDAPVQISGE